MNPIKTWQYDSGNIQYTLNLFNNKLIVERKFDDKLSEEEYSLQKFLLNTYPITSVEFEYKIYKALVQLEQPKDLTDFEKKLWQFWKAFDNSNLTEENIFFDDVHFWRKLKFGFAEGFKRPKSDEVRLFSWQSTADFFFYGPYRYGISMNDRVRIKQELFNCLDPSKHKLTIDDGFILFDYSKIKPIRFSSENGITGKYFKVEEGKCTAGGWDNARDGGENYTSVEYLWYNLNSRVPAEFRSSIPEIRSILEKAIIHF